MCAPLLSVISDRHIRADTQVRPYDYNDSMDMIGHLRMEGSVIEGGEWIISLLQLLEPEFIDLS